MDGDEAVGTLRRRLFAGPATLVAQRSRDTAEPGEKRIGQEHGRGDTALHQRHGAGATAADLRVHRRLAGAGKLWPATAQRAGAAGGWLTGRPGPTLAGPTGAGGDGRQRARRLGGVRDW